jgi:transcriptional regulator with XRE-family HTH domain
MARPSFKIFGKRLAVARNRARLTQSELAQKIKTSTDWVSHMEGREVTGIGPSKIRDLAAALEMTEHELEERLGVPPGYQPQRRYPKQLHIRLEPGEWEQLSEAATSAGVSTTEWAKQLIVATLEMQTPRPRPADPITVIRPTPPAEEKSPRHGTGRLGQPGQ